MARQNNLLQHSTAEFIVSAIPWVTSSTVSSLVSHSFTDTLVSGDPGWVSQFITFKNTDLSGTLTIGFTALGVTNFNKKFTLTAGNSYTAPFATTQIFVSGVSGVKYEIIAGLTNIKADNYYVLSSSNNNPGVG